MTRNRTTIAIVVAAGRGERASVSGNDLPKQYRRLLGEAVISRSIKALLAVDAITYVLPVIHAEHADLYAGLGLSDPRLLPPVIGGATRQASVLEGIKTLGIHKPDYLLVHDAARPLVESAVIEGVVAALGQHDAVLPAVAVTDTIKRSLDGVTVATTEDRRTLYSAQTPQGFRFPQIFSAHLRATTQPREFTDDCAIAEWAGMRVALSKGSTRNIKITLPEDFSRAERMMTGAEIMETRIGTGFDVHPFEPGNSVWLGGVEIPHDMKLQGHSDADVALHALSDALYGAIGEGDIGVHFPPSDQQWKGAPSRIFLEHAAGLVRKRGGRIVNLDITLVCEAPKISPHVPAMQQAIAKACSIATSRIAIKATTSERLGFIGRREGIVAMASASVELPRED